MNFVSAKSSELPRGVLEALASYRYQVFVERLGWALPGEPGCERDQFDRDDTVHALAMDEDDELMGCGRLLPSTNDYLLERVFPQLLNGAQVPRRPDVWELSRFAAMPQAGRGGRRQRHVAERLLLRILHDCVSRGVTTLLTVTTLPVERLMQRAGVDLYRIGPPDFSGPAPILGLVIQVNTTSIEALARFEDAAQQRALGHRGARTPAPDTHEPAWAADLAAAASPRSSTDSTAAALRATCSCD